MAILILLACLPPQQLDILDRPVSTFEISNVPMLLAVSKLRELGVRVCFEEVELDPNRDRIFNEKKEPVGIQKTAVSVNLRNTTLKEVLDALVKADRTYTWEIDKETATINIFPTSSVLNWTVDRVDVENKGRLLVLQDELNLKSHSITPFWRGSYDYYNTPISLHLKETSIVVVLNKLSASPPQLCWTLAGFKGGRILTVVPCGSN